jgi:hypothetical protein
MNYIKHLAGFFDRVSADERLNPTHISMYVSLFQFWNASRFQNPISISRNELMKVSKISSKATYHKCMKQLHEYGYLKYKPSYNPFKGSLVFLYNFQAGNEQEVATDHTKKGTTAEQAQEPYTNTSNISNQTSSNKDKHTQKTADRNSNDRIQEEKEKLRQKKKKNEKAFEAPPYPDVFAYFLSQTYPAKEAEKFYNYFQSNGWLVGGRTPMKDWKAAARNWMLNANKFSRTANVKSKAGNLNATTNKNYSEPL